MRAEPCPPSGHLNCTPNKGTNKIIPFKQTKEVIDYVGKYARDGKFQHAALKLIFEIPDA